LNKPYLVFDFDGTIVQSKMLAIEIFNRLSGKYGGRKIAAEEMGPLSELSIPDRLRALNVPFYKLPALLMEGTREYRKAVVHIQPVEGMISLLSDIKNKGYLLGILSSNSRENIQAFLELHQIPIFDFIHTAPRLFGKDKAIMKLSQKYQIDRNEMLYIGDELRDVEACRAIGVKVVAVTWGFDSANLLSEAKPDFLCHSPADFESILAQGG
jgi:phosphoglycolate phosphatase